VRQAVELARVVFEAPHSESIQPAVSSCCSAG
jgi:hypothetical protein